MFIVVGGFAFGISTAWLTKVFLDANPRFANVTLVVIGGLAGVALFAFLVEKYIPHMNPLNDAPDTDRS